MRSLLVLVLLAALAAGGFLSKPTINTHKAKAADAFETSAVACLSAPKNSLADGAVLARPSCAICSGPLIGKTRLV